MEAGLFAREGVVEVNAGSDGFGGLNDCGRSRGGIADEGGSEDPWTWGGDGMVLDPG